MCNVLRRAKRREYIAILREEIRMDIEVSNPLSIPLQFEQMQLIAHHTGSSTSNKPTNYLASTPTSTGFEVQPYDLILAPLEHKKVCCNFHKEFLML